MKKLSQFVASFVASEAGAEIAEYAVAVAILVAIGVICYNEIANAIAYSENSTSAAIDDASGNTFTPTP